MLCFRCLQGAANAPPCKNKFCPRHSPTVMKVALPDCDDIVEGCAGPSDEPSRISGHCLQSMMDAPLEQSLDKGSEQKLRDDGLVSKAVRGKQDNEPMVLRVQPRIPAKRTLQTHATFGRPVLKSTVPSFCDWVEPQKPLRVETQESTCTDAVSDTSTVAGSSPTRSPICSRSHSRQSSVDGSSGGCNSEQAAQVEKSDVLWQRTREIANELVDAEVALVQRRAQEESPCSDCFDQMPSEVAPPGLRSACEMQLTTIQLRGLPQTFTREKLLQLLRIEAETGSYDFAYLPMDFESSTSLGYAFVNFVTHEAADNFRRACSDPLRRLRACDEVCEAMWSELQGLSKHIDRYKNSPVMHECVPESYQPARFIGTERAAFPPATRKIRPPRSWRRR